MWTLCRVQWCRSDGFKCRDLSQIRMAGGFRVTFSGDEWTDQRFRFWKRGDFVGGWGIVGTSVYMHQHKKNCVMWLVKCHSLNTDTFYCTIYMSRFVCTMINYSNKRQITLLVLETLEIEIVHFSLEHCIKRSNNSPCCVLYMYKLLSW